MALTREHLLRELELLPVWQQREMPKNSAPEAVASVVDIPVESAPAIAAMPEAELEAEVLPVAEHVQTDSLPPLSATLGQGRRETIMQMEWQSLQECVAHCEACSLSKTRTQTVFGVGDPSADWLFVGEAPGAEEDVQGEPFVGQAGKLLDNMLKAIQLKRGQNVYIANVLKCRPPENRDPQGEEVMQCDPFLKRQVELIKPKLIVALGKFAAQSLLNSQSTIAALRGKLHDYHGVPVIVTYHPAYLLRNLPDKAKAWEDLCYARSTMQGLQSAAQPPSTE
jgi:uracil-DNA glycosylase family 4